MTFEEFKNILNEKFPEVTPQQMAQFEKMDALYRDWNSKINVVSRKDIDELYRHHVLHSLGIAAYLKTQMPDVYDRLRGEGVYAAALPMKILDLGTGGGFPGIPLAVMFPGAHFTLCDSIGKKIRVVDGVTCGASINNLRAINCRAEQLDERFDYVVSRAVTEMAKFMPWAWPLLRRGQRGTLPNGILYLKGGELAEELAATRLRWDIYDIGRWFDDEFFETKRVVYTKKM